MFLIYCLRTLRFASCREGALLCVTIGIACITGIIGVAVIDVVKTPPQHGHAVAWCLRTLMCLTCTPTRIIQSLADMYDMKRQEKVRQSKSHNKKFDPEVNCSNANKYQTHECTVRRKPFHQQTTNQTP